MVTTIHHIVWHNFNTLLCLPNFLCIFYRLYQGIFSPHIPKNKPKRVREKYRAWWQVFDPFVWDWRRSSALDSIERRRQQEALSKKTDGASEDDVVKCGGSSESEKDYVEGDKVDLYIKIICLLHICHFFISNLI